MMTKASVALEPKLPFSTFKWNLENARTVPEAVSYLHIAFEAIPADVEEEADRLTLLLERADGHRHFDVKDPNAALATKALGVLAYNFFKDPEMSVGRLRFLPPRALEKLLWFFRIEKGHVQNLHCVRTDTQVQEIVTNFLSQLLLYFWWGTYERLGYPNGHKSYHNEPPFNKETTQAMAGIKPRVLELWLAAGGPSLFGLTHKQYDSKAHYEMFTSQDLELLKKRALDVNVHDDLGLGTRKVYTVEEALIYKSREALMYILATTAVKESTRLVAVEAARRDAERLREAAEAAERKAVELAAS